MKSLQGVFGCEWGIWEGVGWLGCTCQVADWNIMASSCYSKSVAAALASN